MVLPRQDARSNGDLPKTAFFTVVYPEVKPFLADFFASLQRQTNQHFDVIVFNDGLGDYDFACEGLGLDVVDCGGTPAAIRQQGLEYLIAHGYVNVVFGDSDDYFSSGRVEKSIELLQHYDVIVNDVSLVDKEGKLLLADYFSSRIDHLENVDRNFINDRNIFGLSNTAVRLSVMQGIDCPKDVIAADWYLFSRILAKRASAVFSSAWKTFYRQHGANTAGFQQMTPARVLAGVKCKSLHYRATSCFSPTDKRKASAFSALYRDLLADESSLLQYCDFLEKRRIRNPFWWEEIVLPERMT